MNSSGLDNITNTTEFICPFKDTNLTLTLKTAAIVIVGGFGILNNVFIIVLALKYTTRKNLHHLIINMAVADALLALVILGFDLPFVLDNFLWAKAKNTSGDLICKTNSFFVVVLVLVSTTSLGIISIERFRASRKTVRISRPYTLKQQLSVIACSWIVSGALAGHETPYRSIEEIFPGLYACKGTSKIPFGLAMLVYSTLSFMYFGSIFLSALTLRRLSHRREIEASLSKIQRKARAKRISGTVKMVLLSFLLFTVCYIPFVVWASIKQFAEGTIGSHLVYCYDVYIFGYLTAFLPIVNSCFSPCVYLTFLSDFRKAAKAVVCRGSVELTQT